MATHMTELIAMLRDQNRASSSFTLPPEYRPTVDPNPVVPSIYATDSEDISFSAIAYELAVHPVSDPLQLPPAPTAVPLPSATFLFADSSMHALPSLTMPVRPLVYTVPPPMVPPGRILLTSPSSDLIEAGKKFDMGVKLGRSEGISRKKDEEASKRQTAESSKKNKDATVGTAYAHPVHLRGSTMRNRHIPRPHQSLFSHNRNNNMLPLRFSKAEPQLRDLLSRLNGLLLLKLNRVASRNLVNASSIRLYRLFLLIYFGNSFIAAIGEEDDLQETPVPFIIDYAPAEVAFTSASFVIEVLAKESYQDRRVPWDYGSEVANMEQDMSAMGITRSRRVY
ncbi:hypothetical protein CRG98_003644 [Punica granatum]|uniref:Uncharacterized protein n=1 Tax=Punica granatum TaxID=22663 RepID=A0A2I0L797_PUNGR|nr:hypothetical protein CRG98_003644 [Punica granatum]